MSLDMQTRAVAIRGLGLYLPIAAALTLTIWRRSTRRVGAAVLLGLLWQLPALLALQLLNLRAGWWTFATDGPALREMPVELFLGWCCLWGVVPVLLMRHLRSAWVFFLMVLLDLAAMPFCAPVVLLGPHWLSGEAVAALTVLAPCLLLARRTLEGSHVRLRAAMQAIIAAGLFLFLLPVVADAVLHQRLAFALHGWRLSLALQLVTVLALPGLSAVQEFATRGHGTPIPYDPPARLVTSGIYRFVANPMQLSCAAVLTAWAGLLGSKAVLAAAGMAWCYGVGLASWDEANDLRARFGTDWLTYRDHVYDWRICWRPYTSGAPARLYIAAKCGPCSELARWLLAQEPVGLELLDAEDYPGQPLRRLRYVPVDGSPPEDGLRAFARALEHVHLLWALAGSAVRLPGILPTMQLLCDAVGFGEREATCARTQTGSTTSAADDAGPPRDAPCPFLSTRS